jgi:hypothetical protein
MDLVTKFVTEGKIDIARRVAVQLLQIAQFASESEAETIGSALGQPSALAHLTAAGQLQASCLLRTALTALCGVLASDNPVKERVVAAIAFAEGRTNEEFAAFVGGLSLGVPLEKGSMKEAFTPDGLMVGAKLLSEASDGDYFLLTKRPATSAQLGDSLSTPTKQYCVVTDPDVEIFNRACMKGGKYRLINGVKLSDKGCVPVPATLLRQLASLMGGSVQAPPA